MAAWRATLADKGVDMCSSCFADTKYVCIDCRMPICNKCSIFENDEETDGWTAGRSVGHCQPCFNAKKLLEDSQTENDDGGKRKQRNNGRDITNNPERYVMKGLFRRSHVYSKYCFIAARPSQGILH